MNFVALGRRLLVVCGSAWIAALPLPAAAQAGGLGAARDSAVKAAFLYKFGSFVEWPAGAFASARAPFVIGVFGDDAVAAELERITIGRDVEGRSVTVRRLRVPDEVGELHILFAGGAREQRAREMLAAARGPVLTVADAPLVGSAPVLHFVEDQGRLRFVASVPAAQVRGLRLNAKLLAVAHQVEGAR